MIRKLCALALFGMACSLTLAAEEPKKSGEGEKPSKFGGKGGFNRGDMFKKLDANGDGKISKEEYAKFAEGLTARFKDKGDKGGKAPEGFATKMFERLDADKDGVVTKEEFDKGGFKGTGKGKGPGDEKKPVPPSDK